MDAILEVETEVATEYEVTDREWLDLSCEFTQIQVVLDRIDAGLDAFLAKASKKDGGK